MCRSVCALFAYLFLIFVAVGVYSIWRAHFSNFKAE